MMTKLNIITFSSSTTFFLVCSITVFCSILKGTYAINLAPYFEADMNQLRLPENTPIGEVIYTLKGIDPEGSPVKYGIKGTDKLSVDSISGDVTVIQKIDRETRNDVSDNEIRLTVTIEDEVKGDEGRTANLVQVPISVIILDVNDNPPVFRGTPYKASIPEDTPVGSTIFQGIEVTDVDLTGDVLDVACMDKDGYVPDDCDHFEIVARTRETDHDMFRGTIRLKKPLNFHEKQIYRLPLVVRDGEFIVEDEITFNIIDVQNSPPVFSGSFTGIVNEDDPIGTTVLTVTAKDGDTGNPRRVIYDLVENKNNYFLIDPNTGEIKIDRNLDRESLGETSGVLTLKVKASELVSGIPGNDETTTSVADVTITIRDINDEAPKFNKREYEVIISENVPYGTPLANLNMEVKDTDTGPNSVFEIDLIDNTGKFSVEPSKAIGHTAVSLKVNSKNLDYENPNERKFLLLLVAKETSTKEKLSSTATVVVQVQDLNDNSPRFDKDSYTAIVSENSPQGTDVITITAKDRDSGDYGTQGIRYKLSGQGSELFSVDPISGKISVASQCIPAREFEQTYCLDFETVRAYFLSYTATDNNGEGKKTVVNLRITIADANDNPPLFQDREYFASINEGQTKFLPKFFVKARDADESSRLKYSIVEGNSNKLFTIDRLRGEITVRGRKALNLDNIPTNLIRLLVRVTDGPNSDTTNVSIAVKDVNDRAPVFDKQTYMSSVPENAPVGTQIENVRATDADFGLNAQVSYRINRGAYDDFVVDADSGTISLSGALDYDRRDSYSIELVAVDGGTPPLTGTATLTVSVMDKNVKIPYFLPTTQRAHITEDMPTGTIFIRLNATDPDISDTSNLVYSIVDPIYAVNKDGKQVLESGQGDTRFKSFFGVNNATGDVFVAEPLDRSSAASVTLTVQVTDLSATPPQNGIGNLIVTIVDVNDFAPAFQEPWTEEQPLIIISVNEEQSVGNVVHTFVATDVDSNIDRFKIKPKSKYFNVEGDTGNLVIKNRIDYESLEQPKRITFDVIVYDAGVPQKSATAIVMANIANMNDETPQFDKPSYAASIVENEAINSPVVTVSATDKDEGEFGLVHYSLAGTYKDAFYIGPEDGRIVIIDSSVLDREVTDHITLQVVASDYAPVGAVKSATVPVNITIRDVNDNQPQFVQRDFSATIVDNIPYYPDPSPIVQVTAIDLDEGINSKLFYSIVEGNEQQQFFIDSSNGIIYPNTSFFGQTGNIYRLTVDVNDEGGQSTRWPRLDTATILIKIENVNTHKPEWVPDPPPNETIEIEEEKDETNFVVLTVSATDRDVGGDNGRISYYFKQNNQNVLETNEFSINDLTGEVRAKVRFDREEIAKYELVLVARDHGTPIAFETLRFVRVLITDVNDNVPLFPANVRDVRFTVPEEEEPGYKVGRVEASDADEGKNGRVYYYIVEGNEGRQFSIDKSYGNIYTKKKLDREERDHYTLQIKTSNEPYKTCDNSSSCNISPSTNPEVDSSVVLVHIFVEDKNDNLPNFESSEYYVGIPYDGKVGDLILDVKVNDPDIKGNGQLSYAILRSELYPSGSTVSAGSLVKDPSPFQMHQNGRLVLGSLMAEFDQDKFVLDIEAVESRSNHRAKAKVNVWIYEPEQLIKLVITKPPMEVNKNKSMIISELENVTQQTVVVDEIRYHVDTQEGLKRDMTDMYVHVVNAKTNTIIDPEEILKTVDANVDHLGVHYEQAGIKKIVLAEGSTEEESEFDTNLAALITLLLILFLGLVMFSLMCCCVKSWVFAASSSNKPQKLQQEPSPHLDVRAMSALGGGGAGIYNSPTSLLEDGPISGGGGVSGGTDNPLWIDQKYKAYEEQELTMTVFSDQDNSVISGNGAGNGSQIHAPGGINGSRTGSVSRASHLETQSNAYATINKLPMVAGSSRRSLFNGSLGFTEHAQGEILPPPERDYATLEKSIRSPPGPLVPGIHSTPINQGSLPRRYSNDFNGPSRFISPSAMGNGRSNLIINQNGEPELVADLL